MKKQFRKILKEMNDPYSHVKWIYDYFNQSVPYVGKKPSPEEYDLPSDIEERIKQEETKIHKIADTALLALYAAGFIFVLSKFMSKPDCQYSLLDAVLCTLGTYGWASIMIFAVILSDFFDYIVDGIKRNTPLHKSYSKYRDASYAYTYWIETAKLDYWMHLDGHQFEDAVAAVYRSVGYKAVVSKQGGDGGIDIVLEKDSRRIAVQCKAHKSPIGPSVARDLYGTMSHFCFDEGIIVSRSGFTAGVYDFVSGKPISLINLNDLLRLQKSFSVENFSKQHSASGLPATRKINSNKVGTIPAVQNTQSSFIRNIEYRNKSLYLTFKTGSTYCYYNVPEKVYKEMLVAPSKGKFYHERIKDQYPYT